ncbi:hypothetical protein JVU11DRAFT_10830 [Chiua virens]|nr:hypothetical protein JVU11DRAFT_10830 [Chiua virens]
MFPPLIASLFFAEVARAQSANATLSECPAIVDDRRSVWSLLANCGLTLLVCVWHAVHPAVPLPHFKWYHVFLYRLALMLSMFVVPELIIEIAFMELYEAKRLTKHIRDSGYEWWTRTHSHFALNGGFALCDNTDAREISFTATSRVNDFLEILHAVEIINPVVMEDDIKDKSSADALGKVILAIQLSWFITQVIVRLSYRLTVTLVELDTVCMAVLTVPLLFCWWNKPHCPGRPYIFYRRNAEPSDVSRMANNSEKLPPKHLEISTQRRKRELFIPVESHSRSQNILPFCFTWATFGTLHALAWNYEFPSGPERTVWRVASLALVIPPFICGIGAVSLPAGSRTLTLWLWIFVVIGGVSRLTLVVLMFMSLRSLPPSSYQVVLWTNYIPHL